MQRTLGFAWIILLGLLTTSPWSSGRPFQLLFASDRAGHGDIFSMDARGHLTNLTNSPSGDWDPAWSPDGRMIAFTSHQAGQADIRLLWPQTGHQTNLTNHPAWDYAPTWSPDGQQIAFVSERDGDAEIFIQAIDQPEATQLTVNRHPDRTPSWSPDGSKLAFSTVIGGIERPVILDLRDNQSLTSLLPPDQTGSNPVWSPDGREIAFIRWDSRRRAALYTLDLMTRQQVQHLTGADWLGSISWSDDGNRLLFTARINHNHELLTLNRRTGEARQLTHTHAWDDSPALRPGSSWSSRLPDDQPPLPQPSTGKPGLMHGVNLADLANAVLVRELGFDAIKSYVNWATVEPQAGRYRWVDVDNIMRAARHPEAQVLLRIHGVPAWARPADTTLSHYPNHLADFERFLSALARRYYGQVTAYEIWNEPNLNYEWGYRPPNPAEYTALLQSAYRALKAADPKALVISGGLAPTGEGNPPDAWGVLPFIDGMYAAGAQGHFDALGAHVYTYGRSPDFHSPGEITFDQVLEMRQRMLAHGDDETPIWITELGWVLNTHWDLGEHHEQGVSELEQAAYLRRAYERIQTEWPWVQAAFLFNLDFSTAPWYPAAEQMRWFAIINPDRTPRPAFTALRMSRLGE